MACSTFFFQTLSHLAVFLVGILVLNVEAQNSDVDAISGGDSDITSALQQAWNQACKGSNGVNRTVLVPNGNFLLNFVKFTGPCKGHVTFEVNGKLTAPAGAFVGVDQWVLFNNVQGLNVTGTGTFDGLGETAWSKNDCKHNKTCKALPATIQLENVANAFIQGITSLNSKFFHIVILDSNSIDIDGVKIQAPGNSPNTDGIHISRSNGVKIRNSNIGTGDDCVSIVKGSNDVHINNVSCGPGHGFSIGSIGKFANEGDVNGIIVENSKLTNTENGLRIKTWAPSFPSKIFNVTYNNITLNNVSNPIDIDQHYCPNSQCDSKEGESKVEISEVKYIKITGSSSAQMAVALSCSASNPCQSIVLSGLNITTHTTTQPTKATCANVKPQFLQCISPTQCA